MSEPKQYIESGILECYALNMLNKQESIEVEEIIESDSNIREEFEMIQQAIQNVAFSNAIPVNPAVKAFLMATVDFTERIKNGEVPVETPLLNENSKPKDFEKWLSREDFKNTGETNQLHAKLLFASPQISTAIVWIPQMEIEEVHHTEYEKFLILEGNCTITIEGKNNYLKPGDFFSIPLFKSHKVKVTSDSPCKVILQRIAA
ncbi:MAG: hypothetical protein NVS3B19_12110 [Ginsengibacter sp.]